MSFPPFLPSPYNSGMSDERKRRQRLAGIVGCNVAFFAAYLADLAGVAGAMILGIFVLAPIGYLIGVLAERRLR